MYTFLVFLLFVCGAARADEAVLSEEQQLAVLIKATENSLDKLRELRATLKEFRLQEARCIEASDDAEELYSLSEKADQLLTLIEESHTGPYFQPALLDEVRRISKTARNHTIPPITVR